MAAGYFSRPEDKFDNSYTPLWYKLCCILFAGMLCFLVMFLSTSFAFTESDFIEERSSNSTAYSIAALFCYLFEYLFSSLTGIGTSIESAMKGEFGAVTISTDSFDTVFTTAVSIMKTIGFSLCLFFFIMTLVDLLTSERLSFEIFWKHFLKLILGVFMVDNAEKVKDFVIDFGNAFMTDLNFTMKDAVNNPFGQESEFMMALTGFGVEVPLGWLILFGLGFLVGLFPLLLGLIFKGATILIAFSRFLELYLRCTFLPVALALMTDDGWRGAGGRYIKKIIAVSVQGVALIVIGSLVSFACANGLDNMASSYSIGAGTYLSITSLLEACFSTIIISLGIGLAGLSLMFKSMGIVNDVFGV